jgi:hypothetical protein
MRDYATFLGRFASFAEEHSIPWAVIGSEKGKRDITEGKTGHH